MAFANAMIPGNVYHLGESSTDVYINMRWRDYEFYFGDSWKVNRKLTVDYGFRYSLLFTPYVPTGNATNFQPSLYDPNKPATDACNGLWVVPGKDPCGKANAIFGLNSEFWRTRAKQVPRRPELSPDCSSPRNRL